MVDLGFSDFLHLNEIYLKNCLPVWIVFHANTAKFVAAHASRHPTLAHPPNSIESELKSVSMKCDTIDILIMNSFISSRRLSEGFAYGFILIIKTD
jgi:hypothetical protein